MTNHTKAVHCKKVKADIYIGRGSRFGNPFPLHDESMRDGVIQQFSDWIIHQPELLRLVRQLLSGKTLGCFCAPKACHGDVLAAIADGHWDHAIPEPPVFVYGSNRMGINGKGAVKGVARGLNGNAYAIPTKDEQLSTLPINAIREEVDQFIDHARRHPEVKLSPYAYWLWIGRLHGPRHSNPFQACVGQYHANRGYGLNTQFMAFEGKSPIKNGARGGPGNFQKETTAL